MISGARVSRGARPGRQARDGRPRFAPAVKVAAVTTLIIAVVAVAALAIFNAVAHRSLVAQVDTQLRHSLKDASNGAAFQAAVLPHGVKDVGAAPVLLWKVTPGGQVLESTTGAPPLPVTAWSTSGRSTTARIGDVGVFRLRAEQDGGDWIVAAQSLGDVRHIQSVLIIAEAVAGPVLVIAVFLGTLVIGLKASGPVEHARRRQLEFSADASHELRTPLSVIEAETGLALSTNRDASQYVTALQRISGESQRLRSIVNDLLWLARFDSEPANPGDEPVDVLTIAQLCADRFSAVAESRGIQLWVSCEGDAEPLITAPPDWIDRLAGVLVDNACRYADAGREGVVPEARRQDVVPEARRQGVVPEARRQGVVPEARRQGIAPQVRVMVASTGNRVSLAVEDNGPGIPEDQRARLFDRFYRATTQGGGSGLGLAIADAVVTSTGGRWRVDDSPLGGARLQVTWHGPGPRRPRPWWRLSAGRASQLT